MGLSPKEKEREKELLDKFERAMYLSPAEAAELKELLSEDEDLNNSLRMLSIFGLDTWVE
ncbi:MAG: hypothetical protein U9N35_02895 [Euryarchaeota archaeon]|nr:hypothetical protein [Euryarchaeota archaeon]